MLRTHWHWWLAGGLLLALLLASPLAVQSQPLRASADPNVGAVCPLSDDQTQKATQAFEQLAHTFTTEPRCVNCHGAVNPFAADGGTHLGGHEDTIMKPVSVVDQALIKLGVKTATDTIDAEATNQQCQACHDGLSGWRLAPAADVFVGQTTVQICRNQKFVFGEFLKQTPATFTAHIARDVIGGVPFIANAFVGNRGLGFNGIDQYQLLSGKLFMWEPAGGTQADLVKLADAWAAALGPKFQGDRDCGCAAHHYALDLEESTDIKSNSLGGSIQMLSSGRAQAPLTFKDDGTFEAVVDERRSLDMRLQGPQGVCQGAAPQTLSWTLKGSVEGGDASTPGTLHVRLSAHGAAVAATMACQVAGQSLGQPITLPGTDQPEKSAPDIPAKVGETSSPTTPAPPGWTGSTSTKLTIRQLD